jgi:hypothetical protein
MSQESPAVSSADLQPQSNPLAQRSTVTFSFPDRNGLLVLHATALADYERWFFIASVLFGVATGLGFPFALSFASATGADWSGGFKAGVFFALFLVALVIALRKRRLLGAKSCPIVL